MTIKTVLKLLLVFQSLSCWSQNAIVAFEKFNLSVNFLKIEEYDSAILCLKDAIANKPDLSKAYYNLAVCRFNKADFNNCITEINNYLSFNKTNKAFFLKARAMHKLNMIDSAKVNYTLALPIANAYFYLGLINYEEYDYFSALDNFNYCLKIAPLQNATFYFNRALCYEKLQMFEEAANDYNKAFDFSQDDDQIYSNLGYCYIKLKKYNEAKKYLKDAVNINPNNVSAYNNLGLLFIETDNFSEALFYLNIALQLDENNPILLNNRGAAYYQIGNFDLALNDFNKIISTDSGDKFAFFNRANVKEYLLNIPSACEDWHKAVGLGVNEDVVPIELCR